jgi:hypothetical protein
MLIFFLLKDWGGSFRVTLSMPKPRSAHRAVGMAGYLNTIICNRVAGNDEADRGASVRCA